MEQNENGEGVQKGACDQRDEKGIAPVEDLVHQ
jgi:hypothetical protein